VPNGLDQWTLEDSEKILVQRFVSICEFFVSLQTASFSFPAFTKFKMSQLAHRTQQVKRAYPQEYLQANKQNESSAMKRFKQY
jgi:hypothetical protein